MATIKTSELTGPALNWVVAKCDKVKLSAARLAFQVERHRTVVTGGPGLPYSPSTNWAQGGPIIEREGIDCINAGWGSTKWLAEKLISSNLIRGQADTLLIAAMRCYVASKLGEAVDIPDELVS